MVSLDFSRSSSSTGLCASPDSVPLEKSWSKTLHNLLPALAPPIRPSWWFGHKPPTSDESERLREAWDRALEAARMEEAEVEVGGDKERARALREQLTETFRGSAGRTLAAMLFPDEPDNKPDEDVFWYKSSGQPPCWVVVCLSQCRQKAMFLTFAAMYDIIAQVSDGQAARLEHLVWRMGPPQIAGPNVCALRALAVWRMLRLAHQYKSRQQQRPPLPFSEVVDPGDSVWDGYSLAKILRMGKAQLAFMLTGVNAIEFDPDALAAAHPAHPAWTATNNADLLIWSAPFCEGAAISSPKNSSGLVGFAYPRWFAHGFSSGVDPFDEKVLEFYKRNSCSKSPVVASLMREMLRTLLALDASTSRNNSAVIFDVGGGEQDERRNEQKEQPVLFAPVYCSPDRVRVNETLFARAGPEFVASDDKRFGVVFVQLSETDGSSSSVGHATALIFDRQNGTCSYFDPCACQTKREFAQTGPRLFAALEPFFKPASFRYEPAQERLVDQMLVGFQALELARLDPALQSFFGRIGGTGFCILWTTAFVHYRLVHPRHSFAACAAAVMRWVCLGDVASTVAPKVLASRFWDVSSDHFTAWQTARETQVQLLQYGSRLLGGMTRLLEERAPQSADGRSPLDVLDDRMKLARESMEATDVMLAEHRRRREQLEAERKKRQQQRDEPRRDDQDKRSNQQIKRARASSS